MTKIDALYEAAQKATPGPWRIATPDIRCVLSHSLHGRGECDYMFQGWTEPSHYYESLGQDISSEATREIVVDAVGEMDRNLSEQDAAYIAAADPQTVMALVECYRAVKAVERNAIAITKREPGDREINEVRAAIAKVEALR